MPRSAALLISAFIIAADQVSKWTVMELALRPRVEGGGPPQGFLDWLIMPPSRLPFAQIEILPFFNLVMVWNKGVSFGILNQDSAYGAMILIVLTLAITAVFLFLLMRGSSTSFFHRLGMALIIGGAVGNVIDRFRFGAVIDFLDVHVAGYHWPAFNVGDSCVCAGVAILIIYGLFFEKPLPASA